MEWKPLDRRYEEEQKAHRMVSQSVAERDHPLSSGWKEASEPSDESMQDPLQERSPPPKDGVGVGSGQEALQRILSSMMVSDTVQLSATEQFVPWEERTKKILQKYTTDDEVSIQVEFMDASQQAQATVGVDKQKARLEQLDESEEAVERQTLKVSQGEYIRHIEKLHRSLQTAWEKQQRVRALRLAIQCAKLLGDTNVIRFYPSKFVLVTNILDTFGHLVYERLVARCEDIDPRTGRKAAKLPPNWSPTDVPDHARETARNWFFKIASIREVLPRLYVEIAILQCYRFLGRQEYADVIRRMSAMTRGIGDPLVAVYLRAYLARKGYEVEPHYKAYVAAGFNDYLYIHDALLHYEPFQSMVESHSLTMADYLDLYAPAVDWLLSVLAYGADAPVLHSLLRKYNKYKNPLVLHFLLSAFRPEDVAAVAPDVVALIRDSDPALYPPSKLLAALGDVLSVAPPPDPEGGGSLASRRALLNEVWRMVGALENPAEYAEVADAWIAYPFKYLSGREANLLLGDLLARLQPNRAYLTLQDRLMSILCKILRVSSRFAALVDMPHFLALLDAFDGPHAVHANRAVLEAFEVSSDPAGIAAGLGCARMVHDALNALSYADDVRADGRRIARFVQSVDYGRDVERQLAFYADCRRAFANLDVAKAAVVLGVARLVQRTRHWAGGTHSRKSAAFVRAALALAYIVLPSMNAPLARLPLYLLCAQVAVQNAALAQADDFVKAAIYLLPDALPPCVAAETTAYAADVPDWAQAPGGAHTRVLEFVRMLCSTLVALPGHPDEGPFYLLRGLRAVLEDDAWPRDVRALARLAMLQCLAVHAQPRLPYHFELVDSNDALYAADPEMLHELRELLDALALDLVADLRTLREDRSLDGKLRVSKVAIDLLLTLPVVCVASPSLRDFLDSLVAAARMSDARSSDLAAVTRLFSAIADSPRLDADFYRSLLLQFR